MRKVKHSKNTDDWYRKRAKELFQEDGRIEVDEDAVVSSNKDGDEGAYVQAWIWVSDDDRDDGF